jgi:hypothetical protein
MAVAEEFRLRFKRERETKNMVRFEEAASESAQLGKLYL